MFMWILNASSTSGTPSSRRSSSSNASLRITAATSSASSLFTASRPACALKDVIVSRISSFSAASLCITGSPSLFFSWSLNVICRLWFSGRIYRHTGDFTGGHCGLQRLCCWHLFPVSLHAAHRVSQPHHAVQRNLPQPIHPLRRRHRFPSFHGYNCHHPFRWANRGNVGRKEGHILICVSWPVSVLTVVIHSLGHVVNIYIFSVSDLSILSCLFPKVFSNNG